MDNITRLFPIRAVAERTGLTAHVIRAWEKRYDAVRPHRTDTNRRLYSERDVERLNMLRQLTENGHTISNIAPLDDDELRERLSGVLDRRLRSRQVDRNDLPQVNDLLARCQVAVESYDRETLEETLLNAQVELTQPQLMDEFLGPLLKWIGDEWHHGNLRVAQEHVATAGIRNFLGNQQLLQSGKPNARPLVIATPSDQEHEFGALMAALVAAAQGWRVVYLGARVPPQETAAAALKTNAPVVAVSITSSEKASRIHQEIDTLTALLPENVKLIIGGAGAVAYRARYEKSSIIVADDFRHFSELLAEEKRQSSAFGS